MINDFVFVFVFVFDISPVPHKNGSRHCGLPFLSSNPNVAGSEKTERKIQFKTPLNSENSLLKSNPFSE